MKRIQAANFVDDQGKSTIYGSRESKPMGPSHQLRDGVGDLRLLSKMPDLFDIV